MVWTTTRADALIKRPRLLEYVNCVLKMAATSKVKITPKKLNSAKYHISHNEKKAVNLKERKMIANQKKTHAGNHIMFIAFHSN